MSRAAIPLPPFKTLEAALLETTEVLAQELGRPQKTPPQWSEVEWRIAQAVAALQGVSALLSETLQWTGPEHWQDFLTEQKTHTLLREQRIAELLSRIDSRARDEGLGIVALKGAALLDMGVYGPGARPMGDVDLLIAAADIDACARLLTAIGYVESCETSRHRTFAPCERRDSVGFGEHVGNPIRIELHSRIAERLPHFETDITSLEFPRVLRAGLNPYPSIAALMRHLLLHAAGSMRARALRLIQLHDIALLAGRMSNLDWKELLNCVAGSRSSLWWALPPLALTARYYSAAVPPSVLDALASDCPWPLRRVCRRHRLADVSWSKVRIEAFPGIEWSRSPWEAVLHAKSRIWPSRAALAELRDSLNAQPALACVPWYGLPHGARILRWIFLRPPRVQTIFSVRCALGHGPS